MSRDSAATPAQLAMNFDLLSQLRETLWNASNCVVVRLISYNTHIGHITLDVITSISAT